MNAEKTDKRLGKSALIRANPRPNAALQAQVFRV
jgi:hypothetical protein